jgi:Subtilase family/Fervidolysin N-terminal prodomain
VGENGHDEEMNALTGNAFKTSIQTVFRIRPFLFCLLLGFSLSANAAGTNSLVWHTATGRVSADVHGESLWPLLEDIAHQTGWHIFVEPDTERNASVKFKDLPSGEALKMLLGDLNFALVPKTNAPSQLYVFRTRMENATRPVRVAKAPVKHVANELLVRIKPGADIDALAKSLGAKITGRNDKLGLYRLQFDNPAATAAALGQLQNNSDVADVDYNYIYDPPPSPQAIANAPLGPVSLTLNPPGDSGKTIIGLIDTPVQTLDGSLEQFLLKQLSAVGDVDASGTDPTHGTAMAETILRALASASGGGTSAQILPVNVYGSGESTTSWDVAVGIQLAVDNGATVLNLSLAGSGDSSILDGIIQQAIAAGIPVFAAAGNQPVNTPTFPAAESGVIAVTATQGAQLASYANYGSFVDLALPGANVIFLGNQAYIVQGTSVSTAFATGVAAGNMAAGNATWAQILAAMQKKFPVPQK